MKRYNHLWSEVIDFENLLLAARKAERGKRFRENVLAFNYNRERELLQLHQALKTQTYRPGKSDTYQVYSHHDRLSYDCRIKRMSKCWL